MTSRTRILLVGTVGVAAASMLAGCTFVQDTFQVGEREFSYATSAEVEESGESFRFQGFLPDDATDVRMIAQLDGEAAVMRWTSPTAFTSEHCTDATVTSEPELAADWLLDPLPDSGLACGTWTVVSSGSTHQAWTDPTDE